MEPNEFEIKAQTQSHTFILFPFGTPYTSLGWKNYREFNEILNNYLSNSGKALKKKFYIHEYEVILIEKHFAWVVSFFEEDINKQIEISTNLIKYLASLINSFYKIDAENITITNNKCNDFYNELMCFGIPNIMKHYYSLVELGEKKFDLKDTPKPKEKTFEMPLPDLNNFNGELTVGNFIQEINNYLYDIDADKRYKMIYASDGYWSTKYPELKFLREEFIPLKYFIKNFNISNDNFLYLGFERETYDARFQSSDRISEIIVEITAAIPKEDHLLLSLFEMSFDSAMPVKNWHILKKYIDSIPEIIITAIDKKHDKNYPQGRILIVTLPSEYVYQGEDYILNEIVSEVSNNCKRGIGNFKKIYLLCNGKFKEIFNTSDASQDQYKQSL